MLAVEHGETEALLQGEALDVEHSDPVSESLREGEGVALWEREWLTLVEAL